MEQQLLKKYLQNRVAGQEQVDQLQLDDVIAEYPYFNSLHLLAAKKAKIEASDQQSQLLFSAALYACDRKNLYHFIENDNWTKTLDKKPQLKDNQDLVKKEKRLGVEENKIATEEKNKDEKPPKVAVEKEVDPHAGNASFTAWLKKLKDHPGQNTVVEKEKTERETDDNTLESDTSVGELDEQIKVHSYEAELLQTAARLESISGHKDNATSDSEKSKDYEELLSKQAEKSDSFENEGYTETLAKIFVAQKKYAKAIEAYEYLSLKYPEKSSFFAEQIQNLKNKL